MMTGQILSCREQKGWFFQNRNHLCRNHLLHRANLGLSCDHGLAAVSVIKYRCRRRRLAGGKKVPAPQI
jgi:hypothetical protein